ncbi:MAG: VWA domain-containing protein [Acidobacteriota bacterium]|nr:VWA domain-containing protein [Acidobacteriota bacterium]
MRFAVVLFLTILFCSFAAAQGISREIPTGARPQLTITNTRGTIRVVAEETDGKILLTADSPNSPVSETDVTVKNERGVLAITVGESARRIDLTLRVPERARLKITGKDGAIEVGGNLESADVTTETGTIYAEVPTELIKYNFVWTQSRPRFLSDFELTEVKERAGGRFGIKGEFSNSQTPENRDADKGDSSEPSEETTDKEQRAASKPKDKLISLNFTTARGVILVNVPPSEVPSDLRDRELTRAAKTIIQSGDRVLTEAIRKVSPRKFGDYAKTLPPFRREPTIVKSPNSPNAASEAESARRLNVSVTDKTGRAVNGLTRQDFAVFEGGQEREILDLQSTATPFNLVLLLDVSGSVEERIDFIRKAARNFIQTVNPQDRLAVITFRDDVQVLSNFSGNKVALSNSLDTFDAGGGTALYDALAFTLAETLKPLRGERTAIVILSDGDDTRSFIPFEPLLGAIQESGALIYPLYVPSGLIPAANVPTTTQTIDPLRSRYLTLTTKAEEEARRLAEVSGGVYFPIRQIGDLQKVYEDVVAQLRTAYTLTYQPKSNVPPRVTVKRENAFVRMGAPVSVPPRLQSRKIEIERRKTAPAVFQKVSFAPATAQDSNIIGEIKQIKYKPVATESLREFSLETLDVNRAPPAFVLTDGQKKLAVSRWVSPKRTRSYPYERLYNTLAHQKRAAVIPVLKDEGQSGERDFLAWDTFSLLNLLEVYVVLGYYDAAEKSPRRADSLIGQKFNNEFIRAKLKELNQTNLSVFEWNLRELKNLKQTLALAKTAYQKISETTGVKMHDAAGVENFERKLTGDIVQFLEFSRRKSEQAQRRELYADQPKETMPTGTKSRVTITDHLGGKYFLTVDEAVYENGILYLIESKHTQRGKLTHTNDIKDGLIKMILYRNLLDVRRGGKLVKSLPVLRLTAKEMQGAITSEAKPEEIAKFIETNRFDLKQAELLKKLFAEAQANNFLIKFEQATTK